MAKARESKEECRMWCREVWRGVSIQSLAWAQGIEDVPIARVECWQSEFEDVDSPWVEWRIYDVQGICRVRWRIREEP